MVTRVLPFMAVPLLVACATFRAGQADEQATLADLRASQKAAYALPEIGDTRLTVCASLAYVTWSSMLNDEQLLAWGRIWSTVRTEDDRPFVGYELTESGDSLNLFDRSPRDGFCVSWALAHSGVEVPERVRSFLEGLNRK